MFKNFHNNEIVSWGIEKDPVKIALTPVVSPSGICSGRIILKKTQKCIIFNVRNLPSIFEKSAKIFGLL